ncbi:extracellular solute-binding protein [Kribbella sp. NBC_01245]|uniref:ABC transporter substrate-binding protein n=1 Tax=Kribbella sp. NBC_01245 TaxID=2903578 RepID=UPI002E2E328F|nr:extracellular solute-binding protein [Kribbella sp. NBC_01245]
MIFRRRYGSRRFALVTAVAVASASLVLAACGGPAGTADNGQGGGQGSQEAVDAALQAGGTITYWTWTDAKKQVEAFQKKYPNVKVKLVNAGTGDEHYTKLQNTIKAGSGAPDVAQIEFFALPQFGLPGHLVDLRQYGFEAFGPDYAQSSWAISHVGESLVGLPQGPGPMALFYNKKVFDKYGIAVPKTWDEYLAAARKLHQADPTKYITADVGDAGFATSMIWQAGGRPFTVDGKKITVNLADEGTLKWTSVWNQLLSEGLLQPSAHWTDEWFKGLVDGSIATLPFGNWMGGVIDGLGPKVKDLWRVAPMPTYDGGKPVSAEHGGSAQAVLKQSQNPALAAAFLRWLNHEDGNDLYIEAGGYPSSLEETRDPAFLDKAYAAFGDQKINRLFDVTSDTVGEGWQFLPYQTYANSIFGDTVGQSYKNKSDLNAGLKAWQDALVDYGKRQGFEIDGG